MVCAVLETIPGHEDQKLAIWKFRCCQSTRFEEYDAPVLETEEIYTRKAGDEIISQLYSSRTKAAVAYRLDPR